MTDKPSTERQALLNSATWALRALYWQTDSSLFQNFLWAEHHLGILLFYLQEEEKRKKGSF